MTAAWFAVDVAAIVIIGIAAGILAYVALRWWDR